MAHDPFSELAGLVSQYAAEDFVAQRKRLREARMRWIEENEAPTSYSVKTKAQDGEEATFNTPFQVGKIQYPDQYNEEWKEKGQTHEDPEAEKQLLEGLDAVLNQSSPDKRVTVLIAGDEQHAFFTGGEEQSPHPPIKEGEDYGEYFARVAGEYEREAAKTGRNTRGSIAVSDSLRRSAAIDSPGVRNVDAAGDDPGRDARPMLGSDSDALCSGDSKPAKPDAGAADPAPAAPAADPAD